MSCRLPGVLNLVSSGTILYVIPNKLMVMRPLQVNHAAVVAAAICKGVCRRLKDEGWEGGDVRGLWFTL